MTMNWVFDMPQWLSIQDDKLHVWKKFESSRELKTNLIRHFFCKLLAAPKIEKKFIYQGNIYEEMSIWLKSMSMAWQKTSDVAATEGKGAANPKSSRCKR